MKEDSAHPSANGINGRKYNMYGSRSETLISILKHLFYYTLLPVAIYKLLQICENVNSSSELKSLLHIYGCGTWFILICNLLSYYLQFH